MARPPPDPRDDATPRTALERAALPVGTWYATVQDLSSPPEAAFLDELPGAREAILHRVVESLHAERPPQIDDPVVLSPDAEDVAGTLARSTQGVDPADYLAVRERLGAPDGWIVGFPLPRTETILVTSGPAIHGFDRYRATGPAVAWSADGVEPVHHPVDVVGLLAADGAFEDADDAATLREQLAESVANLALARLAARVLARSTGEEAGEDPLCAAALQGADPFAGLERISAIEERPTSPYAKIRRGMDPADGPCYAPEFTDRVHLRFALVERASTLENEVDGGESLTTLLYETIDGLEPAAEAALPTGASPADYAVLPVHPWQFHHVLLDRFRDEISQGRVIPIPEATCRASPLMNLRTVVPWEDVRVTRPHHLKLPVDVRKTSTVRVLEAQMVHNAPRMADLVRAVLADESFDAVGILPVEAAACYYPATDGPPTDELEEQARQLSALARQNPYDHELLGRGDTPVTAACLQSTPPGWERPLLHACIARAARETGRPIDATAETFLTRYIDLTLPFQLVLNAKYGIKLSCHLQNVVVGLGPDGLPASVLVRDLGDSRVFADRLAEQGYALDPYPGSDVDAADLDALLRRTMAGYARLNLAELVAAVVPHTSLPEAAIWDHVAHCARRTFADLREDPAVPDAWVDADASEVFADRVVHPTRLSPPLAGGEVPMRRTVRNPLAGRR